MKLPDFSVKNRVALITGAGRGIGLAMAQVLAAAGAAVAIQDIDLDVARAEADAINTAGGKAIALGGDATDVSLADRLVKDVGEQLGPTTILINNAGVQRYADFLDYPIDEMARQLNCNILFATRLCQLLVPQMIDSSWGRIINLGSIQGNKGNLNMPAYAMSKSAISTFTRALGRRYAQNGITANCIAPGYFYTARNMGNFPNPGDLEREGKHVPVGRIGQPEDCAGITLLLCSQAGEYITGQTIYVDGGMLAR